MLQAIVFDFDGVLVDSEPIHYRALLAAVRPLNVRLTYDDYLRDYLGYDDRETLRLFLSGRCRRDDLAADPAKVAELCRAKSLAFRDIAARGVAMFPGVRQLLDEAHSHLPLAIASGAVFAEIDLVLRGLKLRDHFPVIVSADDVPRSKPDPATYRLAAERLAERNPRQSIAPAGCLAIEDTAAGIASARAAGLRTLGVATTGPLDPLADADRVVADFTGLTLTLLRHWFA